jgi:hypothetical protein
MVEQCVSSGFVLCEVSWMQRTRFVSLDWTSIGVVSRELNVSFGRSQLTCTCTVVCRGASGAQDEIARRE